MFNHPDGLEAIDYRTGSYLIKRAIKYSGFNILGHSKLSVKEPYDLAEN